jgi:hypothetical protein
VRSFLIGDRYAANELTGLLAWPIDGPVLPGLHLGLRRADAVAAVAA